MPTDRKHPGWMGPTKASKTETSLHLLKIKKIKIFYVKNAKQNTWIFLLYQIWCIHYIFEQVTYVWYCLMLVSKKISLMYIFDKLTWAAIGFLVYRITACWFGSASNFTLYMTMFSLNWTNRFPSPKRHLKPKDFYKVIKGQPYWACHLAKWGM